ncbi:MAG TPA: hypothetical protein VHC40_11125 [Rhizomicrobium sp.]|nr:hypothetical protein [Rhizomicrobium sp.]
MRARLAAVLAALARDPLAWILLAAAAMRLTGLFWGLPASDGWDDDGFAPRNFLTALALTWTPGSFFTYPPLHAVLLAIPSLPVAGWALAHAASLHQHDVIAEITRPGYMTYFAVVARLVNLAMSLGIIWCVGAMARAIAPARARLLAAGAAALNMSLVYYGQAGNLDVPYLFWSCLALLAAMRAIAEHDTRRIWHAALLAAAAVATKDQAYAVFLLSLPAVLLLWFAADDWPRRNARQVIVTLSLAAATAAIAWLLVDGAITNSSGFAKRIAFLTGPASGDYAAYAHTWAGWRDLLADMADWFAAGYAAPASLLAAGGLWLAVSRRADRGAWVAGLLPALAILSFTVCFNFVALRTDARFLMPQGVLACVYIGMAADWLLALPRPRALAGGTLLLAAALWALHFCIAVEAAMLRDPRYDAERWMAAHVRPGDRIETYGQNAYLPRFPQDAAIQRVGAGDLKARNPLPGVNELRQPFDALAARSPRFIVVSQWWMRHYTEPQSELGGRRSPSKVQQALFGDLRARRYFRALRDGGLGYRLAHVSAPASGIWPEVHIHESLNEAIAIFERTP